MGNCRSTALPSGDSPTLCACALAATSVRQVRSRQLRLRMPLTWRLAAARQRPVIELEGEVAAPALERRDRARDVESPELIGDSGQTPGGHEPHPGQTLLSGILAAVTVRVVEDLADHVRAIEGEIRHHADRRGGLFRYLSADYRCDILCASHDLALAHPRAHGEQQHYGV